MKGRTQGVIAFKKCTWKGCPDDIDERHKYFIDTHNPRIASNTGNCHCTIVGNTSLPPSKVVSWSTKILKSKGNNGGNIYVGVAPSDVDQSRGGYHDKYGWFFYCGESTLHSGFPHKYEGKEYGPRRTRGDYVHTGDSVGVVMDTTKGEISFILSGVNYGIAYEGISLDKPLGPCVILCHKDDSVGLDPSEVKETKPDISIPVPSNIISKSITWDSITLTWDDIGGVSFYQIEVDGSKSWDVTTTNSFTKKELFAETEHSFRVRNVMGNRVSEWSDIIKGKTQKESFETSGWKECPIDFNWIKKYHTGVSNTRIATKIYYDYYDWCTIIGNTYIPPNKVTSWNIKILKSEEGSGYDICIGIAPFDIDQTKTGNCYYYGWYFDCGHSILYSGPPHKYHGKEYGPRKGKGEYVHTGDSVGVVMDMKKGGLSFVLDGINYGVAYAVIPLDKPLVPCVVLYSGFSSIELLI